MLKLHDGAGVDPVAQEHALMEVIKDLFNAIVGAVLGVVYKKGGAGARLT